MTAQKQFQIALYFFVAIALLGLILRTVPVYSLPVKYSNYLHAHSHVAFLGWLHGAFISFISFIFLKDRLNTWGYKFIYFFTVTNVIGMYFSFPVQGYKFFSILFLSFFLIGTYFYTYYFFKYKQNNMRYPATYRFVKAGLILQIISSISPWSLGAVIKFLGKESPYYKYDIFYYLHFQYNGWFLFAAVALVLYLLENRNISLPPQKVKLLYWFLLSAVFLGYFSNTLWNRPGIIFNILSLLGGASEIGAFFVLLLIFKRYYHYLEHSVSVFSYKVLIIVFFTFMLKAVLQFMGSFQYYADLSYQIRDFIIGYLHLIMLGIFTPLLLVLANELEFVKISKSGFYIFYSGFLITETLIFTRAVLTWFTLSFSGYTFNFLLFIFTLWMFSGITWLVFDTKRKLS